MLQLAYMSVAADQVSVAETGEISAQAQSSNRADEITGVLLGQNKQFLQVLEGPKEAVENTFLRIMTDPRHHSLLLLARRLVTVREFGPWDMANCETDADRQAVINRVGNLIADAPAHIRTAFARCYLVTPPNNSVGCRTGIQDPLSAEMRRVN